MAKLIRGLPARSRHLSNPLAFTGFDIACDDRTVVIIRETFIDNAERDTRYFMCAEVIEGQTGKILSEILAISRKELGETRRLKGFTF